MAIVLRCADQWGREIVLYDDTWFDKTLSVHPEVADQLDAVEMALSNPDRVNYDSRHETGENFDRYGVLAYPYDAQYLKVVARFEERDGDMLGIVISAYPTWVLGKGDERMKWHRRERR